MNIPYIYQSIWYFIQNTLEEFIKFLLTTTIGGSKLKYLFMTSLLFGS